MTVRFTPQCCKVETTCVICPNGRYTENVTLSVDPASMLAIETEENAGRPVASRSTEGKVTNTRVRATRYGFELVAR